jgi:hypothetical protein
MPTLLKDLKIHEVASVDRGAGEGVKIMLMKSDAEIEAYLKREFSDDERQHLASTGAAMPGGGFPIQNKSDLENAIHAYGRAKDKPKTKAHIIARARALGCSDMIPEGWVGKSISGHISTAATALLKSAWSIFQDKTVVDKAAALKETFEQFEDHLQDVIPPAIEAEALKRAKESDIMTEEEKKAKEKAEKEKAEMDKAKEDCAKALAALDIAKREIAVLKLSQKHKDFMDASDMDDGEKAKFLAKTPEERDEHMSKNPIEKRLPAAVQKQLDAAAADRVILKALQEKDEIATFAKRAVGLGLPEAAGAVLRKAYSGDAEGIKKLEEMLKGLSEQVRTGKVFEEFGKSGAGAAGVTAYDELLAKAAEYRESQTKLGKKCSEAQAFAKVYVDPANADLKKRHDADEVKKRMGVAA